MGKGGKTIWKGDGLRVDEKQDGSKVLTIDVMTKEEAKLEGYLPKVKYDEEGNSLIEMNYSWEYIGENEKINIMFATEDGEWLSSKELRKRKK